MSDSDSDVELEKALREGEQCSGEDSKDISMNSETSDLSDDDENNESNVESEEQESDTDNITPEITSALNLKELKRNVENSPNVQVCKELMSAFKSAVEQAHGGERSSANMKNSALFNQVIRLCLVDLIPALNKVLKVPQCERENSLVDPEKSRVWKRMSTSIKGYLADMLKLLSVMTDPLILTMLLKHIVHLIRYYVKSAKLSRLLMKRMISLWSSKEESVRVHALLVVYRITRALPKEYHHYASKHMYFSYVSNTKFTSSTTWPVINFMKRTLVEIFMLNSGNAYESAFVYIRQLSIHLRNAVTVKNKEAYKVVYNWQYVHSILLWVNLLCTGHCNESLKSLIYPLIQIIIGTVNLIPTARYLPLRFHLIRALVKLSEETKVFIPVAPLILEVLNIMDYNKKLQFGKESIDFMCCLKLSKSQLQEKSFRECAISQVHTLLLEYFKICSHTIGFPELALPAIVQLKSFCKNCKISQFNLQIKQVIEKLSENSCFISEKRKSVTCKLTDKLICEWEENVLKNGTPLMKSKNNAKRQKVVN